MELVQDCQKVILTKDLLIQMANEYYYKKTKHYFHDDPITYNFKWDEKDKSLSISVITNY